MSATEEKEQAVSGQAEQGKEGGEQAAGRAEIKPTSTLSKAKLLKFLVLPLLVFGAGFVVNLFIGWVIFPRLLYSEKDQPIDFSHKIHVEAVEEGCESCHFFGEDGTFSGVPGAAKCAECHEERIGIHPEEAKLVEEYILPGKEIPWHIYARQPNCVYFSHAAHIKMAKLECVTCHGPVGESIHVKRYQQNRITGYSRDIWGWRISGMKTNSWDRMKMDDCADCHKKSGARNDCFVCHK
ncbi:MAG: cytochrome c3 family protein [Deltaproteobacteria bacterium]|nr:cytochrome c3 family protein [Deltaproteobacteria bacterium]